MFEFNKKSISLWSGGFLKTIKAIPKNLFSKCYVFLTIIVVGIIIAVIVIFSNQGIIVKNSLSPQQIGEKITTYLNEKILKGQATASLVGAVKENGFIKLQIKIGDSGIVGYATTDGKFFFPQVFSLDK